MSEEPIRLQNAQREIRDAYFAHDSGLFTLSCVPGAGKSVVAHHLVAEEFLRRFVAGDRTPEQRVAAVSFNRDEAAEMAPQICDRLRTVVEYNLVPAASEVSGAELELLLHRVRRAPFVGTVDALLRRVLREIVHEVGFDEQPSVGNDALLKRVHTTCLEVVRGDPTVGPRLDVLEAAYPDAEYDDGVATMLEAALRYCRDRRLSTAAFRRELELTRDAVYETGQPADFADLVAAVERCVGDERVGERVEDAVSDADRNRLVAADWALHDAWGDSIADFCAVLSAYRDAYREAIRDHVAVSHTDVAFLVDAYFDGGGDDVNPARRDRVRQRFRARLRSLVIDEAQDVSAIQHAALSHLVTPSMRVFACGDVFQAIYRWRHADQTLFESATGDGDYLGIDWDVHVARTATTTYRCVPDVAATINAVAGEVFSDPARGRLGDLDTPYAPLEAARDETGETSIHVAAFTGVGRPGSAGWVRAEQRPGEADHLATYLSRGLADGTFTDENGDPLGITVLFRRGTRMGAYEAAFAEEGLQVRNASENLFECPAVGAVLAVCDWLVDPGSPARTATLVTDTDLGLAPLADAIEVRDWALDAALEDESIADRLSAAQCRTLAGLCRLRDERGATERRPARSYLEDVIDALALRADPADLFPRLDGAQRVANLDALVETVGRWEGDERYTPRELVDLVDPFRTTPADGPTQPSAADAEYDVEFRTIHRAKGDQDGVVVVADPGFDLWSRGPHTQRFVAQGPVIGLAPPTNVAVPTEVSVPPYSGGLYDPDAGWGRDVGLRWATAHWQDRVFESATSDALIGPDRLQRVAANERAEAWRLLYVALTRARDHLVVPLPLTVPGDDRPRDRWLETLRDGLGFADGRRDSYTLEVPRSDPNTDAVPIGVNDVDLFASSPGRRELTAEPAVATTPPDRDRLEPWVPRFVNPSTLYPLTEAPNECALRHILGEPLHTETNGVCESLSLPFDRIGPDEVGHCLHDVLTRLVTLGVSESALRERDRTVRRVFDETLYAIAPELERDERDAVFDFFEAVLEDFLASALWTRIRDPETTVTVDRPVDGFASIDDVEIEIHGEIDIVVESPNGERTVADVKITLGEPTPETRRRYELQVATYAYLFERERASTPVRRAVETVGVTTDSITANWPPEIVERRLRRLFERDS
jgi:ATP-dependent helicase/nuclease subunit A